MKVEDLVALLRQEAEEVAAARHNGWANTMQTAADALEARGRAATINHFADTDSGAPAQAADHEIARAESAPERGGPK